MSNNHARNTETRPSFEPEGGEGVSATWRVLLLAVPLSLLNSFLATYLVAADRLTAAPAVAIMALSNLLVCALALGVNDRILRERTAQRDAAASALLDSESRLRWAQAAANIATIDWDFVAGRAVWSTNFEQVFGVPGGVVAGNSPYESFLALVFPDDRGRVDAMHLRLLDAGGPFSEHFRILRPNKEVRWIASRGEVTCDDQGRPRRLIGSYFDVTEQRLNEERLRKSLSIMALAVEVGEIGIWTSDYVARSGTWDERARAIFDWPGDGDQVGFNAFTARVHPDDREQVRNVVIAALKSAATFSLECRIIIRDKSERWLSIRGKAELDSQSGLATTMTGIVLDVTERRARESHLHILLREISHRSKNLLAMIQAMARQTGLSSTSLPDFQHRFAARLQGLATSHDLLVAEDWRGASMLNIMQSQLNQFVGEMATRIRIAGPPLQLRPAAAQNLGLAIHELSTNAVKYGALANATGVIDLSWSTTVGEHGEGQLKIVWRESGGPAVSAPTTQGFGGVVLERVVAQALEGHAEAAFNPSGLTWTLTIPDRYVV